ncbi:hypothetical protein BHQ19_10195 [Mycolicibacterium porcinum]|nr:hypothetical protein BHQ19_10195 [Mycolicibacterium porcinum]
MEQQPNKLEESYYKDKRRRQGIARLALHSAFERTMAQADDGELTREAAIQHMRELRPKILSHLGVVEVGE